MSSKKKFRNKYRIESTRATWWDYSSAGAYFITIVTKNFKHEFGSIENGTMLLNEHGKIVAEEWLRTPEIRPDMNIELGAFVVMPNHFHGIIIINGNHQDGVRVVETRCIASKTETRCIASVPPEPRMPSDPPMPPEPRMPPVPSMPPEPHMPPEQPCAPAPPPSPPSGLSPQSKNLASIIRGFKSAVTTRIKKDGHADFAWHPRYHDVIILNNSRFDRITNYIINNPKNWRKKKKS